MPTARPAAVRIASVRVYIPEKKSPEIKSLMQFVRATPGTRDIETPIIILSKRGTAPAFESPTAIRDITIEQTTALRNVLALMAESLSLVNLTIIARSEPKTASTAPPPKNSVKAAPAAA